MLEIYPEHIKNMCQASHNDMFISLDPEWFFHTHADTCVGTFSSECPMYIYSRSALPKPHSLMLNTIQTLVTVDLM